MNSEYISLSELNNSLNSNTSNLKNPTNPNQNIVTSSTLGKKYKLRVKFDKLKNSGSPLDIIKLHDDHFQNLTHLDISHNNLKKLDLRNLKRLEWLNCSKNQLEILNLNGLSLTDLDCSNNNLETITIEPVPNNLTKLNISFNCFQNLPSWTWMVPELSVVYGTHNQLTQLDCKFSKCLTVLPITELYLYCNRIEFISKDFIQRAARLKILNLCQNELEQMPNFSKRSSIEEVYMSRNRLSDTEDRQALEFLFDCNNLKVLHLSFNQIEVISDKCITAWKNSLEVLILSGNLLRSISTRIQFLSNLKVFRIHSNRLRVSPNLYKMQLLRVIDLSHNQLRKMNLDNLISGGNIHYLDISCNPKLKVEPDKISSNPKRQMNLVEVTNSNRKNVNQKNNNITSISNCVLEFSELPDNKQRLNVTQYRNVTEKEVLFGLFDIGDEKILSKSICNSISTLYYEEKKIEDNNTFVLKYTLLNSLRNLHQKTTSAPSSNRSVKGILCLLEELDNNSSHKFSLSIASMGGIKCILIENGGRIRVITETCALASSSSDIASSSGASSMDTTQNNSHLPDPTISSVHINSSVQYVIIGNQDFWNHVTDDEILGELQNANNRLLPCTTAKRLTDLAQSHSCTKSLSILVLRFNWTGTYRNQCNNTITSSEGEDEEDSSYVFNTSGSNANSNPLADSAIDSDFGGSEISNSKNDTSKSVMDEVASTISQMSVEQFRCWEYMLEQNTKQLFKKELDSLSKATGANAGIESGTGLKRSAKSRKSIHNMNLHDNNSKSISEKLAVHSSLSSPGFYSFSKAKSLSNLFSVPGSSFGGLIRKNPEASNNKTMQNNKIMNKRPSILVANSGPNAAYFSSNQRLLGGRHYLSEIQEVHNNGKNVDSLESEASSATRLRKYWDSNNKITEL